MGSNPSQVINYQRLKFLISQGFGPFFVFKGIVHNILFTQLVADRAAFKLITGQGKAYRLFS
ncbi:hypothetical protein CN380_12335 [Bacillus sp. AFS017274]|nr:hypothetical protein CN380_12335 [Bacillus sp. AFS017274]